MRLFLSAYEYLPHLEILQKPNTTCPPFCQTTGQPHWGLHSIFTIKTLLDVVTFNSLIFTFTGVVIFLVASLPLREGWHMWACQSLAAFQCLHALTYALNYACEVVVMRFNSISLDTWKISKAFTCRFIFKYQHRCRLKSLSSICECWFISINWNH